MDDLKWLIAREIPHLRRYALALLRDPEMADDLVQDCLERAIRKRHLWRREGTIRSWLFRMLFNLYLNKAGSRKRERNVVPIEEYDATMSVAPGQEHHVECRNVTDALELLPDDQRAAILLIALEGLPYDEAACALGIPIGTLRSRLFRGREALRAMQTVSQRPAKLRRIK